MPQSSQKHGEIWNWLCEHALFSNYHLITRAGPSTTLCMASRLNQTVASVFLPGRPKGERPMPI
jgi:hypothetical protein